MMKKLALGLFALLLACAPARAQTVGSEAIPCNQSFQVSQAAVALTRIVQANPTGQGNRVVTWCGWAINTTAAATAQLEYGTGTNCGTGTTPVTPAYALGVNGVLVDHNAFGSLSLPANNDLCLVTTGTGPAQIQVYFTIN